jgi:hypothetical protein
MNFGGGLDRGYKRPAVFSFHDRGGMSLLAALEVAELRT